MDIIRPAPSLAIIQPCRKYIFIIRYQQCGELENMKIVAAFLTIFLVILGTRTSDAQCSAWCEDRSPRVCAVNALCSNLLFKFWCPLSCGLCIPCEKPCELGPCHDTLTACGILKKTNPSLCRNFRDECKATCGVCCKLPPATPCTLTCMDKDPNCPGWKAHCDERRSEFPHVRHVCPLSCGKCERCSLPPTTTIATNTTTTAMTTTTIKSTNATTPSSRIGNVALSPYTGFVQRDPIFIWGK